MKLISSVKPPTPNATRTTDRDIAGRVMEAISPLQAEISQRNEYIRKRDEYIYGDSLLSAGTFANGADKTLYNWLERIVDIHVSQLMGRGFEIYSTYDKRDLSMAVELEDERQAEQDKLNNKRLKQNADGRRALIKSIIRDNGGDELFQMGAQSGSAFGFTVYKSWMTKRPADDERPWNIAMIENISNFYALWSSDNFRETDGYVYVDQISESSANRDYGDYLDPGEKFSVTPQGTTPGAQSPLSPPKEQGGSRPMVNRIEFTGFLPGIKGEDGRLYPCEPGEETEINLLIVGDCIVRQETDEDYIPRYFIIPNQRIMRRPWGAADVTDTCIEVNKTYIERMSDWITLGNKLLYPKYKALNFDLMNIPRPKSREVEIFPMAADQDIRLWDTPQNHNYEYPRVIEQLKEDFVRAARISRVLFDDPNASASNSNQALMTSMKGTIDAVEKKQKIWDVNLTEMFDDALRTLARKHKTIRDIVDPDDNWSLYVKWPSVLRKEDPIYQQMQLNRFNSGTYSVDTFMEEMGDRDAGEELDRLRDNFKDPVTAAILGRQTPLLAQQLIAPPPPPSDKPEVKHTVNWRADMTPQQEANLAQEMGFQDGPFGMSMGPQGNQGLAAQENVDNAGFIEGNAFQGGTPITRGPNGEVIPNPAQAKQAEGVDADGTAAPRQVATPDQNQEGTGVVSQPGSGQAPPASPQGAIDQTNQNNGA